MAADFARKARDGVEDDFEANDMVTAVGKVDDSGQEWKSRDSREFAL